MRAACRIKKGLEHGLELGDISVVRDWGWAPEYMDAAWRAVELDVPEDFVIASGKSITLTRPDGSTVTYVVNDRSQIPTDLGVGKRVVIRTVPLTGSSDLAVERVTYTTTKTKSKTDKHGKTETETKTKTEHQH